MQVSGALENIHPGAKNAFRDSYLVEFLGLENGHEEMDLHKGLLAKHKSFLIELGRDFCFVCTEYRCKLGEEIFR